jgi:hypothetical protein
LQGAVLLFHKNLKGNPNVSCREEHIGLIEGGKKSVWPGLLLLLPVPSQIQPTLLPGFRLPAVVGGKPSTEWDKHP